ncbi:response regulator [Chamaesiphon minutus]|uniref:PAS domain S-box n=1 Tax=Chamaesiphon minutus (strain ATCC 27169 / PCC 6605) TaxID=1173020 RepID=K9UHE6_CHAP6|nr:response regulator [Chamaesiphon minutus]AFY94532.1 PAS domain S-box [Chamaesiphon minutus PCC 6605]
MTNILVVEDESIVAWDIKETLEKLGHQVVDLVVSGTEAIRAATTSRPDLVLMDIRLAGEMDGITAANEIYRQLNIPVVYLTAHADEDTLARAIKTAPFGYLSKPFQAQSLQSTIKVALERYKVEASAQMTQACLGETLDNLGSGIIITDRQGLVTFINPIAQTLTGWSLITAVGVKIERIYPLIWEIDGTAIENPSRQAMRLKQCIKSPDRAWLVTKDRSEIPILDSATPIVKPDGEIVGSVVVFQDKTPQIAAEIDLWEHNQDLEAFQFKLISRLQVKTAEYQQEIACTGVMDRLLELAQTAPHTKRIDSIDFALQQLGMAIDADYCWATVYDRKQGTARICCEYINTDRQIYPISKIGQQIDLFQYPQFYNYLFESENWIDPPLEILPTVYLDLFNFTDRILICPIARELPKVADRFGHQHPETLGEVGIVGKGSPDWTVESARTIAQIFRYAVYLFD